MIQGVGASLLNGEELAGIGVVFHVRVSAHEQRIARDETQPPAGHVEAFAHGVKFHADVHRAGRGKE